MSKIDELIEKLCPSGVEYVTINDLITNKEIKLLTPSVKVKRNDYKTIGKIPIISQEQEYISGYYNNYDPKIPYGEYVCFGDHSEHIKYVNFQFVQGADGLKIMQVTSKKINVRFFYHVILNFYERHNNYERHFKYLGETSIPVPPLEVQHEIVHILDNLSKLYTELSEQLSEELKARQKQYNFYKDTLLLKLNNTKQYKLNEIAKIYDGTHQTPNYTDSGVNFISVENINNIYNSTKFISKEDYCKYKIKPQIKDLFMTRIGSIGKCSVFNKQIDLAYYVSLALIRPNNKIVNSYYLKYLIESVIGIKELRKRTLVNAVPIKVNKDDIGKIELPIPSLEEQERIVNILDRFDKLCNDISEGLPAEIEARKKQYEYYRDKLLTFKELKVNE